MNVQKDIFWKEIGKIEAFILLDMEFQCIKINKSVLFLFLKKAHKGDLLVPTVCVWKRQLPSIE